MELTQQEKWRRVFEALARVMAELENEWPYPRKSAHMTGYSRERGRRAIVKP